MDKNAEKKIKRIKQNLYNARERVKKYLISTGWQILQCNDEFFDFYAHRFQEKAFFKICYKSCKMEKKIIEEKIKTLPTGVHAELWVFFSTQHKLEIYRIIYPSKNHQP